jgi:Zn-dependent protease with chaperone function
LSAGRLETQPGGIRAAGHAGSSPLTAAYGLVFTVLGCVGVSAGQIFFAGDRTVSASATGVMDRCALRFPLPASAAGDLPALARCVAPAYRYQGLFVLGAAAAVVAAAAALTVIVPRNDLRRLRRAGKELPPLPQAAGRFESLCDAVGLAGRRRPRLVIPGLQTREPATIAIVGQRPLIVVPAALANAQGPERFDAAVFHEMAHVRQGDASWVSSVRWIAVVTIPAVILACLPDLLDGGGTQVSAAVLTRAAVFAVLAVVIARWLLRRREVEADRQAAQWLDSPLPLVHLLEAGLRYPLGHARQPSRLLALHPPVPARIAALQDPADRGDGGFGYALVTGVVAAMAMNASYYITWNLDIVAGGWLPALVSAAMAGALLGFALTPSLFRRAARARRAGRHAEWWRPAVGAAAGILLGAVVAPATVPGATAVPLIPGLATRHGVIASLLTACAVGGITALAAGLATLTANRRGPWWPWPSAAAALAIACCTAAVLWPVPGLAAGGPPPVPSPRPVPPAPPRSSGPGPGPGPGQELTKAAVLRVINAAAATLPPGWIGDPPTPSGSAGQATISPAACEPLADADYMNVLPPAAINITGWYRTPPQDMPTGSERFSIEVESFLHPVPPVLLAAARQERGACHQFTATGSGGPVMFTVNPPGDQAPDGHTWRVDFTVVSSGGIQAASTRIVADMGHNLILITAQTAVRGYQPSPDQALITGALNAAISALPRT